MAIFNSYVNVYQRGTMLGELFFFPSKDDRHDTHDLTSKVFYGSHIE
jgi:hypothetical protein